MWEQTETVKSELEIFRIPSFYTNLRRSLLWYLLAQYKSYHRKNLLRSISGKDMGIPIYFTWMGKKYSPTLGNLWKLVSHIWQLYGFLNSINFYSKPMVWEYISFPHNITIGWNFTLPILCGLFGFCNNF